MGTITISAQTSAGTVSRAFPVTDANILRLADWVKETVAAQPGAAPLTNAQALDRWARWIMETTRDRVLIHERNKAALADFGIE